MGKTLCKLSDKEIKKLKDKSPKYKCKKCGNTHYKEKKLCKPEQL